MFMVLRSENMRLILASVVLTVSCAIATPVLDYPQSGLVITISSLHIHIWTYICEAIFFDAHFWNISAQRIIRWKSGRLHPRCFDGTKPLIVNVTIIIIIFTNDLLHFHLQPHRSSAFEPIFRPRNSFPQRAHPERFNFNRNLKWHL